jgi:hypothetical protein
MRLLSASNAGTFDVAIPRRPGQWGRTPTFSRDIAYSDNPAASRGELQGIVSGHDLIVAVILDVLQR